MQCKYVVMNMMCNTQYILTNLSKITPHFDGMAPPTREKHMSNISGSLISLPDIYRQVFGTHSTGTTQTVGERYYI